MSAQTENKTVKKTQRTAGEAAIGKMVDRIFELRKKKAELESAVKDVEGQIADLDSELMEALEKAGIERTATKKGTVSVSTSVVAQVTDWDALWNYIYKNKYGHLLQRRISDPAYRELLEHGKKVPGTEPFSKKRLNYRVSA